jgi:hypothetical protein
MRRFGSTFCMPKSFDSQVPTSTMTFDISQLQLPTLKTRDYCTATQENKVNVPKVERIQSWVQATELAILDTFRGEGRAGVFHHGVVVGGCA